MTDTQPTQPNLLAILSVISGGVSILTACICCYGLPFNVLGIVLGIVAISQINANPSQGGGTLAKVGIGLGVCSFVLAVVVVVGSLVFGLGFGMLGAVLDEM